MIPNHLGNVLYIKFRFQKQFPGAFHPDHSKVLDHGHAHGLFEYPAQIGRRNRHGLRDTGLRHLSIPVIIPYISAGFLTTGKLLPSRESLISPSRRV